MVSQFFFFLSSFLIFLCLIFIWEEKGFKLYAINLLTINILLLLVFSVLDLLFFYIFFEAILLPMFFIIGNWGSRERKIRAVYLFFLYISWLIMYVIRYTIYLLYTWNFKL